jgi:hypothetical protein
VHTIFIFGKHEDAEFIVVLPEEFPAGEVEKFLKIPIRVTKGGATRFSLREEWTEAGKGRRYCCDSGCVSSSFVS